MIVASCSMTSVMAQSDSLSPKRDTTFISFNGKFYIHFPSRWRQVDYQTVDYYQQQAGQIMEYEAVFAPPDASPFFQRDYFVLQADTVGPLMGDAIEPFLSMIERNSSVKIDRQESINLSTELVVDGIIYDKSNQVLWSLTQIRDRDNVLKRTLVAEKLYERGIARFIFYTPESEYLSLVPTFTQVVKSFGSENYEAKIPKTEVVVADTTAMNKGKNSKTSYVLPIAVAAAIIVSIVVAQRKKKSKNVG
jgi:hypothetical protein